MVDWTSLAPNELEITTIKGCGSNGDTRGAEILLILPTSKPEYMTHSDDSEDNMFDEEQMIQQVKSKRSCRILGTDHSAGSVWI